MDSNIPGVGGISRKRKCSSDDENNLTNDINQLGRGAVTVSFFYHLNTNDSNNIK